MRITHPHSIVRRVLDVTGLLGPLTAPIDKPTLVAATHPPGMMAAA
jgi:hypothetical protein